MLRRELVWLVAVAWADVPGVVEELDTGDVLEVVALGLVRRLFEVCDPTGVLVAKAARAL